MAVLVETKRKTAKVALGIRKKNLSEMLAGRTLSEVGGAALEQHVIESRNEWNRNF